MFNLGLKALRRLCEEQDTLLWYRSKLNKEMFKGSEQEVFDWVTHHVSQYHSMPKLATLVAQFPDAQESEAPEPTKYYVDLLERRFFYDLINSANIESQTVLKDDKLATDKAIEVLQTAISRITEQKYRQRILDVSAEGPELLINSYHDVFGVVNALKFGWPYMDEMTGGVMPGDIVSFVGRPASGKTFKLLWSAIHNWRVLKKNVLFCSMEMEPMPIMQRIGAMYAHTNLTQLKMKGYSSKTYNQFASAMMGMADEDAKMYVVDGNLAASVDDIYLLASILKCHAVFVDGAYLLRHKNPRLDRYVKVAENIETMKKISTDIGVPTFCSYQFNRKAGKNEMKKGQKPGLEEIGYSDAIGQISSIVLGLFQEEGVETLEQRTVSVLKGRNGEVGEFQIYWNFNTLDFSEVGKEDTIQGGTTDLEYL